MKNRTHIKRLKRKAKVHGKYLSMEEFRRSVSNKFTSIKNKTLENSEGTPVEEVAVATPEETTEETPTTEPVVPEVAE